MTICENNICLYATILVVFCATAYGIEERDANNSLIIAIVDGVPISYQQIRVRTEKIESCTLAQEVEKLDCKIKEIIEAKAIENLAIEVKEDEVKMAVDAKFEQAGIADKEAHRIANMYCALLSALEGWQQDKTKSANIYKEMLADYMTEAQWHQWQKCYDVPEKLLKLRALIPRNLEDMKKNSINSSKRDLLHNKLVAHIIRGVRVEDEELHSLYAEKYKEATEKPTFGEVKSQLQAEFLETKKQEAIAQWWRNHLREASIEIKDEELKRNWETRTQNFLLKPLQPPKAEAVYPLVE